MSEPRFTRRQLHERIIQQICAGTCRENDEVVASAIRQLVEDRKELLAALQNVKSWEEKKREQHQYILPLKLSGQVGIVIAKVKGESEEA